MLRTVRLFLFLAVSLGAALVVRATAWALPHGARRRQRLFLQALWAKACLRILALAVEVRGRFPAQGAFLVVSNHLGYLDVAVLAAVLPVSFVAKSEVSGWPLIGFFARSTGTLFVTREDRLGAPEFIDRLRARLSGGENMLLFPEGTSSRGETILPFRSTPFCAASAGSGIVPVRIDLLQVGTEAAVGEVRDAACWHGEMEFVPHFWNFLGADGARFRVTIGPPLAAGRLDRKSAATLARRAIEAMGSEPIRERTPQAPGGEPIPRTPCRRPEPQCRPAEIRAQNREGI